MSRVVGEHVRSNVVGYVALFCFLTLGTAQALPGRNKVDSGDIKAGNVKAADLANDSVSSSKVADGSLSGADVADNSLTGADVNESTLSLGPAAPSGPAGGGLSGEYPDPAIAAGAVSGGAGGQIADDTVTDEDLAGSAQFNGASAGADLTGTYPSPEIASLAVGSPELSQNAVPADSAVPNGSSKVAVGAVAADELNDNLSDTVNANDIATNGVESAEVANDAVDTGAIQDGSVTVAQMASAGSSPPLINFPSIANGACAVSLDFAGFYDLGQLAIAQTFTGTGLGSGVYLEPTVVTQDNEAVVKVCNNSGAPVDPPQQTFIVNAVAPGL